MLNPRHQHLGSSPLLPEDIQESNGWFISELFEMNPRPLQLPQNLVCRPGGEECSQGVDAWSMPQYSMGTHLSESEYSVDPVGSLNIPSFSNMTDLYMSLPQTPSIPYNSQNYHLSSPGFNTYSIPIESPGWFPNSQLPPSALPPPYNTELPSIHVQSQPQSHPEVVPLVASPDTRTRGRCPDPQETIQTQMTQRCRDRQPSHPRPTPYSQSSPQIERRAQTTHHSKEQHISVTTSRHSRSPRPTNTDLSESSSRAYESYTSSFPLQPPSDSTTTPLPLEAHLFEFPAQPSTGQRSLSLKVPSASHTNRSHSRANHRQRQSATFAVDPGFDDSPVTRTGVVPLPQGLGIQTKTKRKVEFKVAGHLGVKLADALREDFTLDQPDEAVLPSESDRQIHLCVMWPGYESEPGAYIPLRDKTYGQRISRRQFAHQIARYVAKCLNKHAKSPYSRTDNEWYLVPGKACDNVYIHNVAHVPTLQKYVVQLERRY